jgi:hypothetical protein
MRPLVLCSMLLVAGCVNGSSSYPYYANGPNPLYVPPPPNYGPPSGPPPGYYPPPPGGPSVGSANCGTPDQFKPCAR